MRRPRLVASDLDGTLLLDWHSLSPEALPLIKRLLDEGIAFMTSSGRQYANLRRLFAPVADRISYVAEGGALAFVGDELVYERTLPDDVAREVIDAIQVADACDAMVSGRRVAYACPKNPGFPRYLREFVGFDVEEVGDLAQAGEPIVKVAAFYREGMPEGHLDRWRQVVAGRCVVSPSGNQWVDFVPVGTNKATAMSELLRLLGVDPMDVIAFGDGPNDREMFELVGCPIAMTHGDPAIRGMARYETGTVEEALCRILDGAGFDW